MADKKALNVNPEEASTNFYWGYDLAKIDGVVSYTLQTTIRGNPTPEEINEHVVSSMKAMDIIYEVGGRPRGKVEVTRASAPAPDQLHPKETKVTRIVKMDVTPEAEGKATVKLFGENHMYADLYINHWTREKIVEFFKPTGKWEVAHFSEAKTYDPVSYDVEWVESDKKTNTGKPYKNVVGIRSVS